MSQLTPAIVKFFRLHYQEDKCPHLRLGQRFVNMYIKNTWSELFYADDEKASYLIAQWLNDHQYYDELPQELNRN